MTLTWDDFPTDIASTGNSPITSFLVLRNCTGCSYAPNGTYVLSQGSLATTFQVALSASDTTKLNYLTTYRITVYPVNACGVGTNAVGSLIFTTLGPPSVPSFANPPIVTALTAGFINFTWEPIDYSSDIETGGYPITSYQLLWTPTPFSGISNLTVL